jgi:acetolactate synthase-1/2/3 large subunit/sulfoacetaldehyde acetyltransferase
MPKLSAGEAIVEALRAEDVSYIFGVPGSAYLDILDAMYGREDIRFVGCRHEQGAGFMALGYARASGRPSVCMAQNGPGVTNLVTSTAAALVGHTPVVVLGGASMVGQTYKDSIQELDQMSIFRPVCKAVLQINSPERAPEMLRDAFRLAASGKMGPVYVDMPRDLLSARDLDVDLLAPPTYRPVQRPAGDGERLQEAAELLKDAKSPVVLAGGGVVWSMANEEVVALAEALGAPIVTSYERNDAVDNRHPLYIGALGRAGAPEAAEAVRQADVLLALGTRLSHFTTFYDYRYIPEDARIIQVEIDQREIGRNYPVSVGILGDAGAVAADLARRLEGAVPEETRNARAGRVDVLRKARLQRLEDEGALEGLPMKPQRVYAELRRVLPRDTAVVFDAGGGPSYGYDRVEFSGPRTLFSTLDLACLGAALPQAIGVKMARPDQPVVSISGDGGFFFNAQELETSVRWRVPVVNIVLNNDSWGSEKAYQRMLYDERYVEADITNPRYDKLAELCGARGFYAETPEEVGEAVREALAADRPSVIEIPVDPDELAQPARTADVFQARGG